MMVQGKALIAGTTRVTHGRTNGGRLRRLSLGLLWSENNFGEINEDRKAGRFSMHTHSHNCFYMFNLCPFLPFKNLANEQTEGRNVFTVKSPGPASHSSL